MSFQNNPVQKRAQANQALKKKLQMQIDDQKYWYKKSAQQQLDKIIQEEEDAIWLSQNPNASLGEIFYPSMRKKNVQAKTENNTGFGSGQNVSHDHSGSYGYSASQSPSQDFSSPTKPMNSSTQSRNSGGSEGTFISQNSTSSIASSPYASQNQAETLNPSAQNSPKKAKTKGTTKGVNTNISLAQTADLMQKSAENLTINSTNAQASHARNQVTNQAVQQGAGAGVGAENGTSLERLSTIAKASEAISTVNKPLGTLTNILGLAGELKSYTSQATRDKLQENQKEVNNYQSHNSIHQQVAKELISVQEGYARIAKSHVFQMDDMVWESIKDENADTSSYLRSIVDPDKQILRNADPRSQILIMQKVFPILSTLKKDDISSELIYLDSIKQQESGVHIYEVYERALDSDVMAKAYSHNNASHNLQFQHEEFMTADTKKRMGFSKEYGVMPDKEELIKDLKLSNEFQGKKFNGLYIDSAIKLLSEKFNKETYNFIFNNCQDFVEGVIKLAEEIAKLNGDNLYMM